jgi:hypothetical protein
MGKCALLHTKAAHFPMKAAHLHQIDRVVSLSSDIGGKRRSTMLELSGISLVSS